MKVRKRTIRVMMMVTAAAVETMAYSRKLTYCRSGTTRV